MRFVVTFCLSFLSPLTDDDDYSYGREDSNTMFNGIQDDDFTEIRIQFVEMIIEKNDNMESVLETFVNFQK